MSTPLAYLANTLALGLLHLFLTAGFKRKQDGTDWAMGNRDTPPQEYSGVAARLGRAQRNLAETLPIFAAAVLLAHVSGRESGWTDWGAGLYFWARLLYIPAYAFGLGPVRSVVWGVSIVGLVAILLGLFVAA